tara:strand:- start:16 stop:486 length:471 start_codon:yes stop_codon:yes gene_type:complete
MNNKEIKDLVTNAQNEWARYVVDLGAQHSQGNDINKIMKKFLEDLYAFEISDILFKPTKASINQFRRTKEDFISYFIANNNLYKEDKGFALEPWKKIVFDNFNSIKVEKEIISMGNYYFENFKSETIKVEFTFGYIIDNVGKLRINLHHSSLPFQI